MNWKDADILIFDYFIWWLSPKMTVLGEDWGKSATTNCYNETEPILDQGFVWSGLDRGMMKVAENAARELQSKGFKVQYVNITELSDKRKEGHPSIYRKQFLVRGHDSLVTPASVV
ncbi:protein trichome birefringence-like 34 [Heracleum sosnowskyi]|uniref:Protein trichome birefringence-like 34 n=1 Tax=Heracleum sosnowskyi TaxID=360622 RepID=A0AAD8IZS3_9APIA|nr:protein trichome birefringence-like 34 [Heracleum sosnowskyi]